MLPRLTAERDELAARLEDLSREQGAVDTQRSLLVDFSSSLREDTGTCPVCLRPVTPEERQHAQRAHAHQISQLEDRAAAIVDESQSIRGRTMKIGRWINEWNKAAGWPVAPSASPPDSWGEDALSNAHEVLDQARESLESATARLARVEEERRPVEDELEKDAEAAARTPSSFADTGRRLYRR